MEQRDRVDIVNIEQEMRTSYLDYAMSVIVARALPDVRDGLKPVHRRVLYAMHELGLTARSGYRKSATVVGEVLGKYHPHGDASAYDTLVRMAQDFNMRYPLVDGQGNFGSIDGDSAAAMRYTECRMTAITDELMADLDKETVDWEPNYDGREVQPLSLPARIPNLLVNGSSGIAVGMATNIPPHNLREVVDAAIHIVDHPEATNADLSEFVRGPDFPTGGVIRGRQGIIDGYSTGRGKVTLRARADIVEEGLWVHHPDLARAAREARVIQALLALHGFGLRVLEGEPVLLGMAIGGQQQDRAGVGGLEGQDQVQEDERVGVPMQLEDRHRVEDDPDHHEDGLGDDEPPGAQQPGHAVGQAFPEAGLVMVDAVDGVLVSLASRLALADPFSPLLRNCRHRPAMLGPVSGLV